MINFNIHDVVRGAIQTVNTDIAGTVYVSTGRTNTRGILTPTFSSVAAMLQVQAQDHAKLSHERGLEYTEARFTVYAYGNFSDLERPDGKGGDMCNFNNQWWLVTQVFEWWPAWCSFEVTRQLNAASINALLASLQNGAHL